MKKPNNNTSNGTPCNTSCRGLRVGWYPHFSDVILYSGCNGLEILDCGLYSHESRLAEVAGFQRRYVSHSGLTGEGVIMDTTNLIKVGQYATGGYLDDFHIPVEVAPGVSVMFPRLSERANEVLEESPVVIKTNDGWGKPVVIYTRWGQTFESTLKKVLRNEKLPEGKILKKTFAVIDPNGHWYFANRVDRELRFINLFGGFVPGLNPWKFLTEELEEFRVETPSELPWQIAGVAMLPSGYLVKTVRIEKKLYVTEFIREDPCLAMTEPPAGWNPLDQNLVYRVRGDKVQVVGWVPSEDAYSKRIQRELRKIPEEKHKEVKTYLEANSFHRGEYVSLERTLEKIEWLLDPKGVVARLRREIAQRIRDDVKDLLEHFENVLEKQARLHLIDDATRIHSGRGTEFDYEADLSAIKKKFFAGTNTIPANELKRFSLNREVLRILLRYIPH